MNTLTPEDNTVDVTEWLAVKPGDWIRASVRPGASTGCEAFQGVVTAVRDVNSTPSVLVNDVHRYWANWQLLERRPVDA